MIFIFGFISKLVTSEKIECRLLQADLAPYKKKRKNSRKKSKIIGQDEGLKHS